MADEASAWNDLHGRFNVARINHRDLYSTERGIYTNGAEGFFSRLRPTASWQRSWTRSEFMKRSET